MVVIECQKKRRLGRLLIGVECIYNEWLLVVGRRLMSVNVVADVDDVAMMWDRVSR